MSSADLRDLRRRTARRTLSAAHASRRDEELAWVAGHGWAEALLAADDAVRSARADGTLVGPATGSTHASLLFWSMGTTAFDPLAWGLPASTFYKPELGVGIPQACWYASALPADDSSRFRVDADLTRLAAVRDELAAGPGEDGPVKVDATTSAALAAAWMAADGAPASRTSDAAAVSATEWPDPGWILARRGDRGFNDIVCALALARPGPAACGMLTAYVDGPPERLPAAAALLWSDSRGVPVFRESVHQLGAELLGLGLDETRRFVREVATSPEAPAWQRLAEVLQRGGASPDEIDALGRILRHWSPFLFPRGQALGRAWIALRCLTTGVCETRP